MLNQPQCNPNWVKKEKNNIWLWAKYERPNVNMLTVTMLTWSHFVFLLLYRPAINA